MKLGSVKIEPPKRRQKERERLAMTV